MTKLVYGIGVNDADYQVAKHVNGKQVTCPFYRKWHSMMTRCYSEKYQENCPTYIGCKVDQQWHRFSAFKAWMSNQDWREKHLDKDLLGDGTLYSPETCVFVTQSVNKFMTDRSAARGPDPIGVFNRNGRFRAYINVSSKRKHLGCFDTPEQAHIAWVACKTEIANELIASTSDSRIIQGIANYIKGLTACN